MTIARAAAMSAAVKRTCGCSFAACAGADEARAASAARASVRAPLLQARSRIEGLIMAEMTPRAPRRPRARRPRLRARPRGGAGRADRADVHAPSARRGAIASELTRPPSTTHGRGSAGREHARDRLAACALAVDRALGGQAQRGAGQQVAQPHELDHRVAAGAGICTERVERGPEPTGGAGARSLRDIAAEGRAEARERTIEGLDVLAAQALLRPEEGSRAVGAAERHVDVVEDAQLHPGEQLARGREIELELAEQRGAGVARHPRAEAREQAETAIHGGRAAQSHEHALGTAVERRNGAGGTQTLTVTGTGRYVRINGTARATGYGYSLWEFQVYGTFGGATNPGGCGTTNAAQGKTGHRLLAARTPAPRRSAAVDGNAGTRWSSAVQRPAVDPASTSAATQQHLPGGAAVGGRVRPGVPDPDSHQRLHLDHHLHHHHRHRRHPDAQRHRHRPLRAHERHRPGHRLRLLALGVRDLHRHRQPTAARPADRTRRRRTGRADRPAQPQLRAEHHRLRPVDADRDHPEPAQHHLHPAGDQPVRPAAVRGAVQAGQLHRRRQPRLLHPGRRSRHVARTTSTSTATCAPRRSGSAATPPRTSGGRPRTCRCTLPGRRDRRALGGLPGRAVPADAPPRRAATRSSSGTAATAGPAAASWPTPRSTAWSSPARSSSGTRATASSAAGPARSGTWCSRACTGAPRRPLPEPVAHGHRQHPDGPGEAVPVRRRHRRVPGVRARAARQLAPAPAGSTRRRPARRISLADVLHRPAGHPGRHHQPRAGAGQAPARSPRACTTSTSRSRSPGPTPSSWASAWPPSSADNGVGRACRSPTSTASRSPASCSTPARPTRRSLMEVGPAGSSRRTTPPTRSRCTTCSSASAGRASARRPTP